MSYRDAKKKRICIDIDSQSLTFIKKLVHGTRLKKNFMVYPKKTLYRFVLCNLSSTSTSIHKLV